MKNQIHITEEILKRSANCGTDKIGQNCAIGLAIHDLLSDKSFVGSTKINIIKEGVEFDKYGNYSVSQPSKPIVIDLPDEAIKFIRLFDSFTPNQRVTDIQELSFEIDVPEEVIDMINIDEVKRICEESPSLSLVNKN